MSNHFTPAFWSFWLYGLFFLQFMVLGNVFSLMLGEHEVPYIHFHNYISNWLINFTHLLTSCYWAITVWYIVKENGNFMLICCSHVHTSYYSHYYYLLLLNETLSKLSIYLKLFLCFSRNNMAWLSKKKIACLVHIH